MRWRVEFCPGIGARLRWRVNGALRDVWVAVMCWELHLWWDRYEEVPVLSFRGRWWYWLALGGMILLSGWFVFRGG
jgi:hypothetical protein